MSPPERQPRFFGLEEANRTLPLVRRIVGDIVATHQTVEQRLQSFQRLLAATGPRDDRAPLDDLRASIDREADRLHTYIEELQELGCLFKGAEEGLVDFYARWQDRPIFLCWKLGEEEIGWWHEVEGGFAGRRPLNPDMAAGLS